MHIKDYTFGTAFCILRIIPLGQWSCKKEVFGNKLCGTNTSSLTSVTYELLVVNVMGNVHIFFAWISYWNRITAAAAKSLQ